MPENLSSPQFSTAEYTSSPAGDVCKGCKSPITGVYYRANGAMVCGSCADRLKRELPQDSHAAFVRAMMFGIGGFLVGLIAYSALGILLQGWTIGYFALGVGWIIGKAMMSGSRGVGGRKYQIVAVLLTYAAVSMSAIPISLAVARHEKTAQVESSKSTPSQVEESGSADSQNSSQPQDTPAPGHQPMSFAAALGTLALLGLASPFFQLQEGVGGVLMLVILFVGMRFAWRMTGGRGSISVEGPYQNSASATA